VKEKKFRNKVLSFFICKKSAKIPKWFSLFVILLKYM
jgi:hypothetical protein